MSATADRTGPAPDLKRRILQLGAIDTPRSVMAFVAIVAVIGAMLWLVVRAPSIWTFLLAFALIASRQHALLILLHECWHGLYLPNRTANHVVGQVVGYCVGSKYWLAREHHLRHHRQLGSGEDPDRLLHSSADKATHAALIRYFLGRVLGGQLWVSHELGTQQKVIIHPWPMDPELFWIGVAQVVLWVALTVVTGKWWIYPLFWALPLATATTLLNSVRALTEHAVPPAEEPSEPSRYFTVMSSPLERFFFAPLCFHCHAEHHLFPSIPYHRLPSVRRHILANRDAFPGYQVREGYLAFLEAYYQSLAA